MIKDGYKYRGKLDMTPIDRIETRAPASMIPKGFIQSPMNIVEPDETSDTQHTNYHYWIWFLIIILIVIFAFAVYFFL
jgi:hypothetical protein